MVVVAFFPCDAGCVDVTRTGQLHGLFSSLGAIGLPAAAMVSAQTFRLDGRLGPAAQIASFWLGLLTLVSGPLVAAGLVESGLGLLQRAGMWVSLVWMMVVSAWLFRRGGVATRWCSPARHHPEGGCYRCPFTTR